MRVGLFFGSFNPVHNGHLALANYIVEYSYVQSLWFVITPQNPLKNKTTLLPDYQRYELVIRAIGNTGMFSVSDIEFKLPKPSYTSNTLQELTKEYPGYEFSVIMGSDTLETLPKWKNSRTIINNHFIIVYPRPGHTGGSLKDHRNIIWMHAPQIEISSSFIRDAIKSGKNLRYFMPDPVWNCISEKKLYKK